VGPSLDRLLSPTTTYLEWPSCPVLAASSRAIWSARVGRLAARTLLLAHAAGVVVRDVKPHNFSVGLDASDAARPDKVYLLDAAMCMSLADAATAAFSGTPDYASRATLSNPRHRYGPADDLESLAFVVTELQAR